MRYAMITAGIGFVGANIARRLLADGLVDKCVLVDFFGGYVSPIKNLIVDYRRHRLDGIEDGVVVERGQTQSMSFIIQMLYKYRPVYIFHLAALPLATIENLTAEEAMEGAVVSTANLLEGCQVLKGQVGYEPGRFVYASSSMVYGDFQYTPADEAHPLAPRNIYGAMKAAGETITLGLARTFNVKAVCIRPSAVYGPTDMNRRVSQIFIENAVQGKKSIIQGADEALDFTYVEDTANGFVLAATKEGAIGEVFNITAGNAFTLLEYMEILKEHFPEASYEVHDRDHARPKRGTLSIEKARRILGYQPAHTLRQGLEKYIAFIKKYGTPGNPE